MKINTKKIISIVLVLVLFITNTSFVFSENTESCTISDPPKQLTDYVKNVRKVIKNISNKAKLKNTKTKSSILNNRYIDQTYWALNSLFSWVWNDVNYSYYIQGNIWEVPSQIKRDIKFLEKQYNYSKDLLVKYSKNNLNSTEVTYDDICNWIDEDRCTFIEKWQTTTLLNIFTEINKSTKEFEEFLEDQATDKNFKTKYNIYLITDEDLENLKNIYSKENLEICNKIEDSSWEKWFFGKVLDAIKKISFTSEKWNDSMNNWEEAFNLALWSNNELAVRQKEREVLARELNRQWIWWDSASTIMWNLDAYNNSWTWKITLLWWKKWFQNSIQKQVDDFKETIKYQFKKENKKVIPFDYVSFKKENLKNDEEILNWVNSLYKQLKNLSLEDNNEEDILIDRIINIHLSLSESINTLNKTCKVSIKTCNEQKSWEWDCGQCN